MGGTGGERDGARRVEPGAASGVEALLAGRALRAGGITVDLAPVADVPGPGSFMAADDRTFGASGAVVGPAVTAFTRGLADARVAATAKHFPGIGRATSNTDSSLVVIRASRGALESDLAPFRAAIGAGVPMVMISNASYPALDSKPAPWSPRIQSLLRNELGFKGVTITDALDGAAATRGRTVQSVAVLSAQAGVDILLLHRERGIERGGLRARRHGGRRGAHPGRVPASQLRPDPRAQAGVRLRTSRVVLGPRSLRSDHFFRRLT